MSDLQAKYQKLAAEYSKIRSQIPVLKKAVLDEQAASEEFKETIKSRDQSIRKFEQEVDSLTFRNQQLELRVSVLQKELEQTQPNHGKRQKDKKNSQVPNLTQSVEVIDEELRLKIEENAKLHRQVTELDQEHQKELSLLEMRMQELEEEVARLQSELDDNKQHHHGDMLKLTREKEMLEEKIVGQESERLSSMEKVQLLEKELALTTDRLTRQLDRANKIICQKVPFNDTADESLNSLNVRCQRVQNHARSRDITTQANQVLEGLIASFENLFGHIEVKVNALSLNSDFKGATDDLRQFLHSLSESDSVVRPLKASLLQLKKSLDDDVFAQSVAGTRPCNFSEAFDNFVSYSKQIVSCELQCLEIELNQSSCTEMLSARISDLQRSFVQFATTLADVHHVLTVLLTSNNDDVDEGNKEAASRHKQLMQFSQVVMTWMEACKDLSRSYKSKSSLEHQLPTSAVNIKMADERIEGSLSDLVDSASKLSSFLSSNVQSISDLLDSAFSSDHPCLPLLKAKAIKYRELITREAPESVPSSVAVQNRKLIEGFAQNKNDLSQQVLQLQEKLTRVEQEREHWSLEAQLMTMKCKKEIEKFNALAKHSELSSQSESSDRHAISGMTMISELGKLEILNESGEVSDLDWVSTREKIVSDHYDRRIDDLISSLQQADSKALYFHSECRALHKQLAACTKERDRLQGELNTTNQGMVGLRDELQTTSRSYEGQLSLMSEHLAGMNEKLTVQRDEIDALKYQLIQQNQQNLQGSKSLLRRGK